MDSLLDRHFDLTSKKSTPLFGNAQPSQRVTTDDLLDMQFPLKSLTYERIQEAYALKMKGRQTTFQPAPVVHKQTGIDIDSLLDQNVAVQSGYIAPSNVIIREVTLDQPKASDVMRKEVSTAERSRFGLKVDQGSKITVGMISDQAIAQQEPEFHIQKYEPIVERELEFDLVFSDYQI